MATTLNPTRLQHAEHYCTAYAVVLQGDHSLEDALAPGYWANVALMLRQHDTIRLIPEDGSYFAELLVLDAGRGFVHVKMLRHIPLEASQEEATPKLADLFVKWDGPHNKFIIMRKSDGEKLKTGIIQKVDAQRWLDDHLASLDR